MRSRPTARPPRTRCVDSYWGPWEKDFRQLVKFSAHQFPASRSFWKIHVPGSEMLRYYDRTGPGSLPRGEARYCAKFSARKI
jgi:hypothetical protein